MRHALTITAAIACSVIQGCSLIFGVSHDDYARRESPTDAGTVPQDASVHEAYLYLIGGSADGIPDNRVYAAEIMPDASLRPWQEVSRLPTPLQNHSAVVHDDSIYVLGGSISGTATSAAVYVAKILSTGTLSEWAIAATMPAGRKSHTSDVLGNRVYVSGGSDNADNGLDDVVVADIVSGRLESFRPAARLDSPTSSHASSIERGHLFVIGGRTGSAPKESVLAFRMADDGSLEPFRKEAPLPNASAYQRAVNHDQRIYLFGAVQTLAGTSPPNLRAVTKEVAYASVGDDGTVGQWATTTELETARWLHACSSLGNVIYLSGGYGPNMTPRHDDVQIGRIQSDSSITWTRSALSLPRALAGHTTVIWQSWERSPL